MSLEDIVRELLNHQFSYASCRTFFVFSRKMFSLKWRLELKCKVRILNAINFNAKIYGCYLDKLFVSDWRHELYESHECHIMCFMVVKLDVKCQTC